MSDYIDFPDNWATLTEEQRDEFHATRRASAELIRRDGIAALSEDQLKAVIEARDALREFVCEWTECLDLHDAETPRKLQRAFWSMNNVFDQDLIDASMGEPYCD